MGVYFEVAKKTFQENYAYRFNSYFGILSSCLSVIILISVWNALFIDKDVVNQTSLSDLITFVIVGILLSSLTRSDTGRKVARKVVDGTITNDFIRPINFKYFMFADTMGASFFRILFQTLPVLIFTLIFWDILFPSVTFFILFLISVVLGVLIIFHLNFIIGLLSFWNQNANLTFMIYSTAVELFGGSFVPLWFYPEWLYKLSILFPFHLVFFQPINIYLEKVSFIDALYIITAQLIWFCLLLMIEKLIWRFASDRIEILGG